MPVLFAYLLVILIWASTPLAVKLSSADGAAIAAVAIRFLLALGMGGVLLLISRRRMFASVGVWRTYLMAAISLFPAMPILYSVAAYVPSGLIAVLYSSSPFFTLVIARIWIGAPAITVRKLVALLIAIGGMIVLFYPAASILNVPWWGIAGVLSSAALVSFSSVGLSRATTSVTGLELAMGAILFALPGTLIWWGLSGFSWPENLSMPAITATVYLASFGSLAALSLYFYLLKHLSPAQVSLITLITPVLALLLGRTLANEAITLVLVAGTALITLALLLLIDWKPGRWFERCVNRTTLSAFDEARENMHRFK